MYMETHAIQYIYQSPREVPAEMMEAIGALVRECQAVGTSFLKDNLQNAFLIGYALAQGQLVGTSTHKVPKAFYRKRIEEKTGLDLEGFLERGYTAVREEYRGQGIGGNLIRGLIEHSEGKRVYVTIRMNNVPALRMTHKEGMVLAARFLNEGTGHTIGVFVNGPYTPAHVG